MTIVFSLLGAAIGAAIGDDEGFFAGIAIGFLFGRVLALGKVQRELRAQLDEVTRRINQPVSVELTPPIAYEPAAGVDHTTALSATPESSAPEPLAAQQTAGLPSQPNLDPVAPTEAPARTVAPEPPAPPPVAAAIDRLFNRIVKFFTTGNVVARVGVVVLFFGFAFLIRLAAESGMLPIELRLAAVALGGFGMLVAGWRLRAKRPDYAVVVQGGGVGVLYLVIFAAARMYDLMPMSLAFGLMVVMVVASGALAVLQNAPALAVLGVSGGFLAPILTSTGQGSHVALFSYYALLNAGILGIVWFRAWRALNLLGFVFTYAIGSIWGARYYQSDYFASVEPFVVLSFLFYLAMPLLYALRQPPNLRGVVDGTLLFGNPIVFFTIQNQLVEHLPFGRALSALVLGLVYAALTGALWRRDPERMRLLVEVFLAMAALFATLAIPFALNGHWTAAAWSLEGAGVLWIGLRQRRYLAQVSGLVLQVGAALLFFIDAPVRLGPSASFDTTALGAGMIALAALFSAYRVGCDRDNALPVLGRLDDFLLRWALIWWLGALTFECDLRLPKHQLHAAFVVVLSLTAVALSWLAQRLNWRLAALPSLGLLPLGAIIVVGKYFEQVHVAPWQNGGGFAWPLLLVCSYALLKRYSAHWPAAGRTFLHAAGLYYALFLFIWLAAYSVANTEFLSPAWILAVCGVLPAATVMTLSGNLLRECWPFSASATAYRHLGLAPLLGLSLSWLVVNFTRSGGPDPLPYVPLINPLDSIAFFSLIAALAWWRRMVRDGSQGELNRRVLYTLLAAAAFVVLNTVVLRSMHHFYDVPYGAQPLWHSPDVQAALSLTWAVLGSLVMALAARRSASREQWIVGAALLGVVVAKLFLVDLASSGAVGRIVSFLGVGGVCLVIGYFAPIPPRAHAEQTT